MKKLILLLAATLLLSCSKTEILPQKKEMHLVIPPYSDLSEKSVQYVYIGLKKIIPNVKLLPAIELPEAAYYPPRNRYRADKLIRVLAAQAEPHEVYLGMTSKDISVKKGTEKDWGVLGLGFLPGKSCVISTFRLSKKNTDEQLYKVAVHELAHTQGLPHCPEKTCYVRDAEGGNLTNQLTGFCTNCKNFLIKKGWNLK